MFWDSKAGGIGRFSFQFFFSGSEGPKDWCSSSGGLASRTKVHVHMK